MDVCDFPGIKYERDEIQEMIRMLDKKSQVKEHQFKNMVTGQTMIPIGQSNVPHYEQIQEQKQKEDAIARSTLKITNSQRKRLCKSSKWTKNSENTRSSPH